MLQEKNKIKSKLDMLLNNNTNQLNMKFIIKCFLIFFVFLQVE